MNKKVIAAAIGLVAVVAVGIYASGGQGGLQGFLKKPQNQLHVSVAPNSPSGARAVSVEDNVAIYHLCSKGVYSKVKKFDFTLASDNDFDVVTFNHIQEGDNEMLGNLEVLPIGVSNPAGVFKGSYTLNSAIFIDKSTCKDIAFNFDTATTMSEDAGTDDPFSFKLDKLYDTDAREIKSNIPPNTLVDGGSSSGGMWAPSLVY